MTDDSTDDRTGNVTQPNLIAQTQATLPPSQQLLEAEWVDLLRQIEREIVETLDFDQVLTFTVDAALRMTGADDVAIALTEPPDLMRVVQTLGKHYQTGIFPLKANQGIVGRTIATRKPVFIPDVSLDPDYIAVVPDTRAQIVLPLLWRGELLGIINLETREPSRFTERGYQFLQLLMDRVALALDNARAHRTVRRQVTELRDLYDRVSGLERLKSTLIEIAAHDLRNPLGAIRNLAQLLLRDPAMPTERRQKILESQLGAAEDALKIIDDLMLLRRVESGGKQATFRSIEVADVLLSLVEIKRDDYELRHQRVEMIAGDGDTTILGEPVLMREAFANLLDNAIKYTPENGSIRLDITPDREWLYVSFVDTGYGINPEELAHIFQPFYRAPSVINRGIVGTGLGLHIVKQIIEQHGGTISASSTPGTGSTFQVKLPLFNSIKHPPES